MEKWGVLGSAVVAQTLTKGLKTHGFDVRIASRTPAKLAEFSAETGVATGTFAEVAAWADHLILAVAGSAAEDALNLAGADNLRGKVVIDTTNPIAKQPPEDGVLRFFTALDDSLMERLQRAFPDVRFVKAFNSVGNARMVNPQLPGGPPTMFYCGDDADAKATVARLLVRFGWDVLDMGTVKAARAIEPLCILWCISGFRDNLWSHAFKVLRP